jgi:UDP-N-acetylmuramate--alanine ligase
MDPTISVGGILKAINGNVRIGKSENFITEAFEYTNSFLKFNPFISIILNIEEDHMDFFKDIHEIRDSFKKFTQLLPKEGLLVINGEIENYNYFTDDLKSRYVTYGIDNDNFTYTAKNITYNDSGFGCYDLYHNKTFITKVKLGVVGKHNISNSLATIAVALECGINIESILAGIAAFSGTVRRFEYKGTVNGINVIDDYAHHPTEIKATIEAAKKYPHKNMWIVFQPHTYTRTKAFLNEFAQSLSDADNVILVDIYAARENDPGDISSKDLYDILIKMGTNAYYFPSFEETEKFLLKNCINGDLLITMGAGNVVEIGESLLKK